MLKDENPHPNKYQIIIWGGLIFFSIGLFLLKSKSFQIGADIDDSSYIILARSLLHSTSYGLINNPGTPAPGKFPFGYPFILALFSFFIPNNQDVLRIPSLLATIANISIVFWGWRWLSKKRSYWWGLAIASLLALSPITVDLSRRVMSEPVFTTFCLLTILLTEELANGNKNVWVKFALGLALFLTVFTRTVGILLFACVFAYLFIKKGIGYWKGLSPIVAVMVLLSGIVVWTTPVQWKDLLPVGYLNDSNARFMILFSGQPTPTVSADQLAGGTENGGEPTSASSYISAISSWNEKLSKIVNLLIFGFQRHLGVDIRQAVLPIGGGFREQSLANQIGIPIFPQIFGFFISFTVILGLFRLIRHEEFNLFGVFSLIYLAAIFFWYWDGTRLLYPIQPQILLGFVLGIEGLILIVIRLVNRQQLVNKLIKFTPLIMVLGICVTSISKSFLIDDSRQHVGDLQARSSWLKSNTKPQAIVMTENPQTDYLYSDRKTVPYPFTFTTAVQLNDYMIKKGVDFILVAPAQFWQLVYQPFFSQNTVHLLPLLQQLISQNRVQLIYSTEQDWIRVYKVQK
jgi:4-amino-4-deoxy-L-arabinose transferase-like glycosyltransferase